MSAQLERISFRASARTVDMLGRQQIAGIPTAISELFKNAFDAYADIAVADFIRHQDLFILRDDGVGMSREEFVERWLTLGTESKLASKGLLPPPRDPDKAVRPVLGEKGIGRLAIAAIGPQVLVLTRSKFEGPDAPVTAAFINWTLFECPGLTLDDIHVPVQTFAGHLPRFADITRLVDEIRNDVTESRARIGDRADVILRQLDRFAANPTKLDELLGEPSIISNGHGVHFFITPSDPSLIAGLRSDGVGEPAELQRLLLGFNNTMTPDHPKPALTVRFNDHRIPQAPPNELIGERVFFTEQDFAIADHHISGRFDEFGQFEGSVAVYRQPAQPYRVAWPKAMGTPTDCGPFTLNLAYVQGARADSGLDPEAFAAISDKLNRWGGLYVYRDGIRVLPYGSADNDWLDIEARRTKSASYYFFSYRRLFGVVEITRAENSALQEKAGREGFRQNEAYRQLSDILKNFFPQVAADFFREDTALSEAFVTQRAEFNQIEAARRRRESQIRVRRSAFRSQLEQFFGRVNRGEPEAGVAALVAALESSLAAAIALPDPHDAALAVVEAEVDGRRRLQELRDEFKPVRPRGVPLPRDIQRDAAAMRSELTRLERDVFGPASEQLDTVTLSAAGEAGLKLDRRLRLDRGLTGAADEARRATRSLGQTARLAADEARQQVVSLAQQAIREVEDRTRAVLSEAAAVDVSALDDVGLLATRSRLEGAIDEAASRSRELLEAIRSRLEEVASSKDPATWLVTPDDITAAIEEELIELRDKSEADLELAQLGMAVEVINHEFQATIKTIRTNIGQLKQWADMNSDLQPLYSGIRTSFEHLDGYLTLFTPLHRRLQRTAIDFAGSDIERFLRDLFRERFDRHKVELVATPGFRQRVIRGFPSTFYPVFVNLVDNAIFWLDRIEPPRRITLDGNVESLFISDNGHGIELRDREAVFELGFTRKPGGRGLGLYIARQVLSRVGWLIEIMAIEGGSAFRLYPDPARKSGEK